MNAVQDKQNLNFENFWQRDASDIAEEVLQLWNGHGGPVGAAGRERLRQLVFAVREANGRVVGLSTAFKVYIKQLRHYFYAIRLMLLPEYRIPGLTSKLLVATRDFLELIHAQDLPHAPIGIITLVENPRLREHRNEAVWPASGMVYIGNTGSGQHIRVYYFKGARIVP